MAIYLYFSESGRPKTDTRKFLLHVGARGSRGPIVGARGSRGLAGARVSVHGVGRWCSEPGEGHVPALHWAGAVGATHAGDCGQAGQGRGQVRGVGGWCATWRLYIGDAWTHGSFRLAGSRGAVHGVGRPGAWTEGATWRPRICWLRCARRTQGCRLAVVPHAWQGQWQVCNIRTLGSFPALFL